MRDMIKKAVPFGLGFLFLLVFFLLPTGSVRVQAAAAPRFASTSVKIAQGHSKKLKIKNKRGRKVKKWWSSNKKIVTVENGKITAVKGGKATIAARIGKHKIRCQVTVVGLNRQEITLSKGEKFKLKVKNGKNTKWKSSNKKIVKVSKKGVIKAKKTGKATITCISNGRKIKCKVYVASLATTSLRITVENSYQIGLNNAISSGRWASSNNAVAQVDNTGTVRALQKGTTQVTCKVGKAELTCKVTVINPTNITTAMSTLPAASKVDRQSVSVEGYPTARTYVVYRQNASVNAYDTYPKYMTYHGCAACAAATVLSGFKGTTITPQKLIKKSGYEYKTFGSSVWKKNYAKDLDDQMPVSLYGITKILNKYGVAAEYVRTFSDTEATAQIKQHLRTGNPVIIEVSKTNRHTGQADKKWSNSYHTLALLGMTDTGQVIVADSVNRTAFGEEQRIKYATVEELIPYMYTSTNLTSTSCYFSSKAGGYILVNPQN